MDEHHKREAIKKYFRSQSNKSLAIALVVIGVPFLLAGGLGLILIIIGGRLYFRSNVARDDAQIDAWMAEDFQKHDFVARAKELSTFDSLVRDPVLLKTGAPLLPGCDLVRGERIGEDGVWRRSIVGASVLLCNDEQLGIYQTGIDSMTGNRVGERFTEVFYQDVTGVDVVKETDTVDFKAMLVDLRAANFSAREKEMGLSRSVMAKNLDALKRRFAAYIFADILQRESLTVFRVNFSDGRDMTFPIVDRRATAVANEGPIVDPVADEVANQMLTFRQFVRDMKRRQISGGSTGAAGALI